MAHLLLSGRLDLTGSLHLLASSGGVVKAGGNAILAQGDRGAGKPHGRAPAVLLPPNSPIDDGTHVWVFRSFNATVTVNHKPVIAQGMCAVGTVGLSPWPGMVQASSHNPGVTINKIPANVVGDIATVLPTGAPAQLTDDCQQP